MFATKILRAREKRDGDGAEPRTIKMAWNRERTRKRGQEIG